jgi:methanogenic corrinoid protein MtbC1
MSSNGGGGAAYDAYLEALIAGDRRRCWRLIESLVASGASLEVVHQDMIQKALYEVGDRWQSGEVGVAEEHLASHISEWIMGLLLPHYSPTERVGRLAVISCAQGERHAIGPRMVADAMEVRGWDAIFLGADLPIGDLVRLTRVRRPDLVGVSITTPAQLPAGRELAGEFAREFADTPLVFGGQASAELRAQSADRTHVCQTLGDLAGLLDEIERS